jgi:hypothetical protein
VPTTLVAVASLDRIDLFVADDDLGRAVVDCSEAHGDMRRLFVGDSL